MKEIMIKKRHGFTLAEVLITIGVIGVISAMAIPALIQNIRERQTVAKLQTTYSILVQAIRLAEQESGGAAGWVSGNSTSQDAMNIADRLKPYLKILEDCGVRDTNRNCIKTAYKKRNGSYHADYAPDTKYYKIVLMNGTSVWWRSADNLERANGSYLAFFVDTNGGKLPNMWGNDLFSFIYKNETLEPTGHPDSVFSYTTNCIPKTSTGFGCAYYVLQNRNLDYLH